MISTKYAVFACPTFPPWSKISILDMTVVKHRRLTEWRYWGTPTGLVSLLRPMNWAFLSKYRWTKLFLFNASDIAKYRGLDSRDRNFRVAYCASSVRQTRNCALKTPELKMFPNKGCINDNKIRGDQQTQIITNVLKLHLNCQHLKINDSLLNTPCSKFLSSLSLACSTEFVPPFELLKTRDRDRVVNTRCVNAVWETYPSEHPAV